MNRSDTVFRIKKFPIFTGVVKNKKPTKTYTFPLNLYYDEKTGIPRLIQNNDLKNQLTQIYNKGSLLSTSLGSSNLSTKRMIEFLKVMQKAFKKKLKHKIVVEIGCGTGSLLNEIKKKGAEVIGYEIGPQAKEGIKKFKLDIRKKEISEKDFNIKVDIICSYGCLEHILDPIKLIDTSKKLLKPGGMFFHRFPNTDLLFKTADISDLCHEHVSYFTAETCKKVFISRGFEKCNSFLSRAKNEVHVWGFKPKGIKKNFEKTKLASKTEKSKFKKFCKKLKIKTKQITLALQKLSANKNTKIGFYAGGHIYCFFAKITKAVRFFDGDEKNWGGRWLPSLPKIECPKNLKYNPVDLLIVCREH